MTTTAELKTSIASYQTELYKAQQKARELEELMKDAQDMLKAETAKEKREEFDMMKKWAWDCIKIDEFTYARKTEEWEIDLYYQNSYWNLEVHTYEQHTYERMLEAQINDAYMDRNWIWEMWVEEVRNGDTDCSLNEYCDGLSPDWNDEEILEQAQKDHKMMPEKWRHELPEEMTDGCIWTEYESNTYQTI